MTQPFTFLVLLKRDRGAVPVGCYYRSVTTLIRMCSLCGTGTGGLAGQPGLSVGDASGVRDFDTDDHHAAARDTGCVTMSVAGKGSKIADVERVVMIAFRCGSVAILSVIVTSWPERLAHGVAMMAACPESVPVGVAAATVWPRSVPDVLAMVAKGVGRVSGLPAMIATWLESLSDVSAMMAFWADLASKLPVGVLVRPQVWPRHIRWIATGGEARFKVIFKREKQSVTTEKQNFSGDFTPKT